MAAQTVCRNIVVIFYMIPVGISMASSILVGQKIGSRNMREAKIYAKMSVFSAFLWGIFFMILMGMLRPYLSKAFTNKDEVNSLVNDIYPLIMVYVLMDCLQMVG